MLNDNDIGEIAGKQFLDVHESNARTYARTIDCVLARGNLAKVWDINGTEYIDCLAGAGALALGHNHPVIVQCIHQFLVSGHIQQALDIATVAKIEFVRRLFDVLPTRFSENAKLQFCGPTGSDAVEAAIKLFKTTTGRRGIIAFGGAYHGMTMGSMSLMGDVAVKQDVAGLMSEVQFMPYPHAYRCPFGLGGVATEQASLNYLESVLTDPKSGVCKPAMVILEAVQGEGGGIPASTTWLRGVRDITERLDIPLVIDEVQTGFGRTGVMFAHEAAGIVPDAIVMSKAIGGGFPLSVLAYHQLFDRWSPGAHAGTFRGNQIAFAAGAATMSYLVENDVPAKVAKKGELFLSLLSALMKQYPCIGEVRGRGLMIGVEIVDPGALPDRLGHFPPNGQLAHAIKLSCLKERLIVETGGRYGAVVRFLPPLIISEDEIREVVARFESAIEDSLSMVTTAKQRGSV